MNIISPTSVSESLFCRQHCPLPVLTSLFFVWWQKRISFINGNQTGLCLRCKIENKTSWQSHVFMSMFSIWLITLRVKGDCDMKGDFGKMAFITWAWVHTRNHVTSQQAPFLGPAKLVFNALYKRRREKGKCVLNNKPVNQRYVLKSKRKGNHSMGLNIVSFIFYYFKDLWHSPRGGTETSGQLRLIAKSLYAVHLFQRGWQYASFLG